MKTLLIIEEAAGILASHADVDAEISVRTISLFGKTTIELSSKGLEYGGRSGCIPIDRFLHSAVFGSVRARSCRRTYLSDIFHYDSDRCWRRYWIILSVPTRKRDPRGCGYGIRRRYHFEESGCVD